MAFYKPDYDYIKGKELLEGLKGKKGELIKYYVNKKDERIERLDKIITEMKSVFNGIAKYTKP